jgi:carboxylesterase type B
LSLDTILNVQRTLVSNAVNIDPSTGLFQPIRPVRDGSFITSPLDSTAPFPSVNKPVLISTVLNEIGPAIYSQFPQPLPADILPYIYEASLGTERTNTLISSDRYPPIPNSITGVVDARDQLQLVGTDYMWKCSSWTFTRAWVQNGGKAYVGLYTVGASYPGNDAVPYCTQPGVVCHQDDIEIVVGRVVSPPPAAPSQCLFEQFGTVENPTPAQAALVTEMQKRYKAFLTDGNPNARGLATWLGATTSDVHALQLGGSGEAPIGACDPSFWGQAVPYDYQVYGI